MGSLGQYWVLSSGKVAQQLASNTENQDLRQAIIIVVMLLLF